MTNDYTDIYEKLLNRYKLDRSHKTQNHKVLIDKPISADERIKQIKAKGLEQDIDLKKGTLDRLFIFLMIETAIIFIFSFLQATKIFKFSLEEWSFKLLVSATLLQITYMLQVAVKHLFPSKSSRG